MVKCEAVEVGNELVKILSIKEGKSDLKEIEYKGFHNRDGKIIYQRSGSVVIFSAITSSGESTSSVNAAEAIIAAICKAESVDPKDPGFCKKYEFFDLSTPVGYPNRKAPIVRLILEASGLKDVQIDKLEISPRESGYGFHVDHWIPMNSDSHS